MGGRGIGGVNEYQCGREFIRNLERILRSYCEELINHVKQQQQGFKEEGLEEKNTNKAHKLTYYMTMNRKLRVFIDLMKSVEKRKG